MQHNDKVAIVTGGGSGLGLATVQQLAKQNVMVAALDVNQQGLDLVADLKNCMGVNCDVTNEQSVIDALNKVTQQFGVPRICVNFAGILGASRVLGRDGLMKLEHFRHVIDVDLVGTFNVARLAAAQMAKLDPLPDTKERGVIINIASIAAFEGQIGQVAYSAAKAGVVGMTLPMAREFADLGIRVMCIAPGVFATPMMSGAPEKVSDALMGNTVFPKRFGEPHEIAILIDQIISNPMLNGDTIRIDGAIRMPPK